MRFARSLARPPMAPCTSLRLSLIHISSPTGIGATGRHLFRSIFCTRSRCCLLYTSGLVILASESKDFRLLAHLLRTLQHAGDPHLALRLLALYVEHYWAVAAPQNMAHKKRFASQVIKRFETGIEGFSQDVYKRQGLTRYCAATTKST